MEQDRARLTGLRWLPSLLAVLGAGTFLYAAGFPLVDSSRVCCPRLMGFSDISARTLTHLLPLGVPAGAVAAAVALLIGSATISSVARGVLLAAGVVGMALIVHGAGGIIAVKGGIPAMGSILGFTAASLILAAAVLGWVNKESTRKPWRRPGSLALVAPAAILLGSGLFIVAVLMPWTTRPHPIKLVWLPPESTYWIWSTVVPAGFILPTVLAGLRMLADSRQRPTEVGVALAGGLFGTLLFLRVVGHVVLSGQAGPPDDPPVFSLEPWAYLGLLAGSLIVVGAVLQALLLRRSSPSSPEHG
jgi:hypothetical protein